MRKTLIGNFTIGGRRIAALLTQHPGWSDSGCHHGVGRIFFCIKLYKCSLPQLQIFLFSRQNAITRARKGTAFFQRRMDVELRKPK
jgi:hypothetical protein